MALNANGGEIVYTIKVDASGAVVGIKNAENKMGTAAESAGTNSGGKLSKGWAVAAGAVAGITSQIFSKVASVISSSMDSAISRVDTLNNFPKVMSNLGVGADDASQAINLMSDKLVGLPTTLDDAAAAVQRFTSKNGDVSKSTDLFLALNNAIIAGGAPTEQQATALEQMSQAYAKGKPDMMEWRSLMSAMPAQLNQVAQAMGYGANNADALGEDLRNGKVSMDDFMGAVVQLNTEGLAGFQNFEEQARNATAGIGTQITNIRTAITKLIADALNGKDMQKSIDSLVKQVNAISGPLIKGFVSAFSGLAAALPQMIPPILDGIMESLPALVDGVMALIEGLAEQLPTIIAFIWQGEAKIIEELVKIAPDLIMNLVNALTKPETLTMLLQAWITLGMTATKALPEVIIALVDALPVLIDNVINFLTDPNNLNMIIEAAVTLFFGIVKAVPQILGALLGAFGKIVGSLWEGIKRMFGEFASNFGNFIGNIFRNAINGVLSFIEGFINGPIDLLNGFIKIINDTFGGIGVNIGYIGRVNLPRLASGGIVEATNGGRIIMAGEGGEDEWVVPESKMASLMDKLGGGRSQTVNIYVDGVFATSPEERRKVADDIMVAWNQSQKRRLA